jgi:hypothetical protein
MLDDAWKDFESDDKPFKVLSSVDYPTLRLTYCTCIQKLKAEHSDAAKRLAIATRDDKSFLVQLQDGISRSAPAFVANFRIGTISRSKLCFLLIRCFRLQKQLEGVVSGLASIVSPLPGSPTVSHRLCDLRAFC